jgi:hypothetical protein
MAIEFARVKLHRAEVLKSGGQVHTIKAPFGSMDLGTPIGFKNAADLHPSYARYQTAKRSLWHARLLQSFQEYVAMSEPSQILSEN